MALSTSAAAIPIVRVTIHTRWYIASPDTPVSTEASERMPGYAIRYAQTLGVTVHAVGGAGDHLHLLFDLPADKSINAVMTELQRATARFLQDVLTQRSFAWETDYFAESISAEEKETLAQYIAENRQRHESNATLNAWEEPSEALFEDPDTIPGWLREALP